MGRVRRIGSERRCGIGPQRPYRVADRESRIDTAKVHRGQESGDGFAGCLAGARPLCRLRKGALRGRLCAVEVDTCGLCLRFALAGCTSAPICRLHFACGFVGRTSAWLAVRVSLLDFLILGCACSVFAADSSTMLGFPDGGLLAASVYLAFCSAPISPFFSALIPPWFCSAPISLAALRLCVSPDRLLFRRLRFVSGLRVGFFDHVPAFFGYGTTFCLTLQKEMQLIYA